MFYLYILICRCKGFIYLFILIAKYNLKKRKAGKLVLTDIMIFKINQPYFSLLFSNIKNISHKNILILTIFLCIYINDIVINGRIIHIQIKYEYYTYTYYICQSFKANYPEPDSII